MGKQLHIAFLTNYLNQATDLLMNQKNLNSSKGAALSNPSQAITPTIVLVLIQLVLLAVYVYMF